ncbi:MAG: secondary thiamine-phosphate synthase enzyme YjbQ [Isosphaeraceae bacterium]
MPFHSESLQVPTQGRGTIELTRSIQSVVERAGIEAGICLVFVHHTSASLILCENAEPEVRRDLERFFSALVPDGDPRFRHDDEGPDDMPAHVRSILTQNSLTLPVSGGRCDLGTWQGIYLYEHRTHPHRRRVTISVMGG